VKILFYCGINNLVNFNRIRPYYDLCYGFDANPDKIELAEKIYSNDPGVKIIYGALTDKDGEEIEFTITTDWDPAASLGSPNPEYIPIKKNPHLLEKQKKIRVPTINLYDFCVRNNISQIDTLLTDLQGIDFTVLKTLTKFIQEGKIREIQCEVEPDGSPARYLGIPRGQMKDFNALLAENYDVLWMDPPGPPEGAWEMDVRWRLKNTEATDHIDFIFENELLVPVVKNCLINFVYAFYMEKTVKTMHKGNVTVILSANPLDGCDIYLYHNAFSYKGPKGGVDYLLMLEPAVVLPGEFTERIWRHFDHVFGLFDALMDRGAKFHKILFPRADLAGVNPVTESQSRREASYPLQGRKNAICMISGNKSSHVPFELYSKRIEIARWFAEHSPMPFDVFGKPAFQLSNYRGIIPDGRKLAVMRQYRFSLCFENTNAPVLSEGYVTEKILDCLEARTIPIYLGATNIERYIPSECYIDFRKYADYQDLSRDLLSFSEKRYNEYIKNIDAFVCSGGLRKFSEQNLYHQIIQVLIQDKILDARYFNNDGAWRPGPSSALRHRELRTSNDPAMWTWKFLSKADPPVVNNRQIIDQPQIKNIANADAGANSDRKTFLIGKKPAIKVLAAGNKFFSGNARLGYDYGWWNHFDTLNRFENIEMHFFDYATEIQQRGLAGMAERLYEAVCKEKPDILLYSPASGLAGIQHDALKSVTGSTDTQTVIWMNHDRRLSNEEATRWADCVDYVITLSPELAESFTAAGFGSKIIRSQWGFNPHTYAPSGIRSRQISFCGAAKGNRADILDQIKRCGLSVDVFGLGWHENSFIPFYDMVRVMGQSRINLNLGNAPDSEMNRISRRIFEAPGCLGFLMTTPLDHLEKYYEPGREVVTVSSTEELIDKAKYYLAHEREREAVARRGYERTLAEHTWANRFIDIFKHIGFAAVLRKIPVISRESLSPQSAPVSGIFSGPASFAETPMDGDQEKIETSIAVMAFNQLEYTKKCVESILHYTKGPYELILTDNGSTDGTFHYFEWVKSFHPHTQVIRNFANRNVEALSNEAFSRTHGKYIAGVANDAVVHDGWLDILTRHIESSPDAGLVGTRSNNISGPQIAQVDYDTLEAYHTFAAEWSKQHRGSNFIIQRLVGVAAIMKKSMLERIGHVDPDLPVNGRDGGYGFSDDDISLRMRLAGYTSLIADDVLIHHYGSVTTKHYRPDLFGAPQNINKEKFIRKVRNNNRIKIDPDGQMTLLPYGPDDVIPVDERTIIRSPRVCFVETGDLLSKISGQENHYTAAAEKFHGTVISSQGQSIRSLILNAVTEKQYDFLVLIDSRLTAAPDAISELAESAVCHPDVAIMVPVGNYAPATHARKPEKAPTVEIIPYADMSICVVNLGIFRPLQEGLMRCEGDDDLLWFMQRRARGESYFIGRTNTVIIDGRTPVSAHPYDNRALPEQLAGEKNYAQAAAIYREDIQRDPQFADAYYQLACLARMQHQNMEAARQAELALAADPHHIESLILLSCLSMDQNNWKKAQLYVSQANFKRPGNPEVQKIVERYEKAVKANPDLLKVEEPPPTPGLSRSEFTADRTSIIIAATSGHARECLAAVKRHTAVPYELIVLDALSSADQKKKLRKSAKEHSLYRILEHPPKNALLQSINRALDGSTGEYIVLLADDTIVSKGWLSGMLSCLHHAPESGVIGPMTNGKYGLQQTADDSYLSVNQLDAFAASFKKTFHGRRIPCRNPAGFCLLFRRALAGTIGLLDERFEKDHFEHEDFCWRAAIGGYKNFIAGDVFVHSHELRPLPHDRKVLEKKWILSSDTPEGKKLAVIKTMELAETLYARGQTKEAVEALVNCITFRPDDAEVYYALCRIFLESRQFSEAWDVFGTMPDEAKNNVKGLEHAGYIKEGLGLDDEAQGYADRILSSHENHAAALNLKGVLAFKQGEKDNARNYFIKAMEADPGFGDACTNLGVLFWGMERKEEALAHLQRGFMLSPTVPDHSSIYYSALSSMGAFGLAEDDFREVCRLYPNYKNLVFLYVDILIQLGKPDVAMLRIEDALTLFGLDDGLLNAALAVRDQIGPRQIGKPSSRGTLSFCMIVKNEEKYLVKCLRSIRDIADEIIIVDTGSTDKTVEIARVFGARLFDFPWTGDFSAARNKSLEEATGDWIFALDADEVIDALDYDELKKITDVIPSTPAAYAIETRNYLNHETVIGWTPYDGRYPDQTRLGWMPGGKVRLFTRSKDIYFIHPVHELVEHSLKTAGIPIYPGKVVVHHYGKLDEMKDWQKGEDYYMLGKMKYENDPTNAKYILELAKQAQLLQKNDEATELWMKLLALIGDDPQSKAYRTIAPVTYGDPLSEIYTMLAASLLALNRFEESLAAARQFMEMKTQKRKEYVNVYAQIEIIAGSLEKALAAVEEQLSVMPGYSPVLLLKAVIVGLEGNKEEAGNILRDLRAKNFEMTSILNRMAKRLRANKKSKEALIILSVTVENGIGNAETKELLLEIKQEG